MKEHIHCKVCKAVIEELDDGIYDIFNKNIIYYNLKVCEKCVVKAGIKRYSVK